MLALVWPGLAGADTPVPYLCLGDQTSCCDPADAVSAWSSSSEAVFTLCLEVGSVVSSSPADCDSGTGDGDELCAWQIDLESPTPTPMTIEDFSACTGTDVTVSANAEEIASTSLSSFSLAWLYESNELAAGSHQCIGTFALSWTGGDDPSFPAELDVEASSSAIQADMDEVSLDTGPILVPEPTGFWLWLSGVLMLGAFSRRQTGRRMSSALALGLLLLAPLAEAGVVGKAIKHTPASLQLPSGWSIGASISAVGDLNQDGVEDVLLGSPDYDSSRGAAMFLLMRPDGSVDEVIRFGAGTPGLGSQIAVGDRFGEAMAVVGDLDGDGGMEVAVAAPGRRNIFLLSLSPRSALSPSLAISGVVSHQFAYPAESLAAIGDLDQDGLPDLAVGHPSADIGCSRECGSLEILSFNSDLTLQSATMLANGSLGQSVLAAGERFGASLAYLGRLYGSSTTVELAVGSPGRDSVGRGGVYIVSLTSQVTGQVQTILDSQTSGFPSWTKMPEELGNSLGALGDLDNDGDVDLAIGAFESGSQEEGAVVIVRLSDQPGFIEGGVTIEAGELPAGVMGDSTNLGRSLAGADIDGDGVQEVWVGAQEDASNTSTGDGVVWQLQFADSDGDSVPDFRDNCENIRNVQQLDFDRDGTGDKCDNCMRVENAAQGDLDDDGIGDACEATEVRLIEDPDDQDEDRWRLEIDCGALGDADQLVVALTPLGGNSEDFTFGGPRGSRCRPSPFLCANCIGCQETSGNSSHLGDVVDAGKSGAFMTDWNGDSTEVSRSNLRPNALYVTLFAEDDLCTAGGTQVMGDLFWDRPQSHSGERPHVKPIMSQVDGFLPLVSKTDSLKDIRLLSQRPVAACRGSSDARRSTRSSEVASGVEAILLPLVSESDDLSDVGTFELCFTSDSYLLHRLTVAVEPPLFDADADGILDAHSVSWQDCDGATDAKGRQYCSDSSGSLYDATSEDSVYSSVQGKTSLDGQPESFAWLDTDPTHSTNGYLFLVAEGNMALSSPSLGALTPLLDDMQCVARLDVSPSLDLSPCAEEGEPGYSEFCSVEERLPTLIVPSAAEFFAETEWCDGAPLLVDNQAYLPGAYEPCTQPCGTLSDGVASTMSEDADSDERRNEDDNCIYTANTSQMDSGGLEWIDSNLPEGMGDACQCGDATGDGIVSSSEAVDLAGLLGHLVSPDESVEGRCSVDDEESCTIRDIVIHKRTLGQASLPADFEPDQCEAATGS